MWVELKGLVVDNSLADLGIDSKSEEVVIKLVFNIDAIDGYREMITSEGVRVEDEMLLYTSNGTFVVQHSFEELKKLINDCKTV